MNKVIKGIFPLVVCAAVLMVTQPAHAFLGSKFKDEVEKENGAVKLAREVVSGDYGLVKAEELKAWKEANKDMVIVDTMPYESSYKKAHVPGALQFLFPIPEMKTWNAKETDGKSKADYEAMLGADKDKTIVVYCGFVKCTRSHNGALWAKKLGYKNVFRFAGGIYAWKGMEYPTGSK